jgi:hypothetical protein
VFTLLYGVLAVVEVGLLLRAHQEPDRRVGRSELPDDDESRPRRSP